MVVFLSFSLSVGSRNRSEVTRLGRQAPLPLSYLTSPKQHLFKHRLLWADVEEYVSKIQILICLVVGEFVFEEVRIEFKVLEGA